VKLLEFEKSDVTTGMYDPAGDKFSRASLSDTRKPILTLRDLNRLKKMRALQQLERLKREDLLAIMYAAPEEGGGLGGGMGGTPF
jgi:hypothetical protein